MVHNKHMSDLTRCFQYHKKQSLSGVLIISYNVYIFLTAPRGHMSTSRVYEPIYTVNNLYNCTTASFFPFVYVYVFFKVEYLYYLPKLHRLEPHYQTVR